MERIKKGLSRIFLLSFIFSIILSAFTGCSDEEKKINSIYDLNNKKYEILIEKDSASGKSAGEKLKNATFGYISSRKEALDLVSKGRADAFCYGKLFMQHELSDGSYKDLIVLKETLDKNNISVGVNKNKGPLLLKINKFIEENLNSGLFDEMYVRWIQGQNIKMPDIKMPVHPDFNIVVGTSGDIEPITYFDDNGKLKGFDAEFIYRLASYLNAKLEIKTMGEQELIDNLISGKIDIVVSNLNDKGNYKDKILLSNPYRTDETGIVIRKDMAGSGLDKKLTSIDSLNGQMIGIQDGSTYQKKVENRIPKGRIQNFSEYVEFITALKSDLIDTYVADRLIANCHVRDVPGLYIIDETITYDDYALIMNKDNPTFNAKMNNALKELKEAGVIERLKQKWSKADKNTKSERKRNPDISNGIIRAAVCADQEPFSFIKDGIPHGFEVDIILKIAEKLKCDVTFTNLPFDSLTAGVSTGNYDIGGGTITITEEKKNVVAFTDPFYVGETVAILYDEDIIKNGFLKDTIASFKRTFVVEQRWKLIVEGLINTIFISIIALILGTIFGFFFCFMMRSKNKFLSGTASLISTFLDGMPILITVMIFYYIIFSKTSLPAVWVGILAMTLDFGNAVAGTIDAGIENVAKGEIEAAISMGYTKFQIFTKITMPQVIKTMSVQYNNAVVSLIKGTSIVGYITVQDLTKAGDIIRTRTYEAFFPLIAIAVIYFLLAYLIILGLKQLEKLNDPSYRKRTIKGVVTDDRDSKS